MQLAAAMDTSLVALLTTGAFIAVLYYPHVWLLTTYTVVVCSLAERDFTAYEAKIKATAPPEPRRLIQRLRPAWQTRSRLST